MQRLVRSIPGSRAARMAAFTAVVVLVPLHAWTEEAPRAEIASSTSTSVGAPGSPAEPALTQPALTQLPPAVPAPPIAPELEDPWRPLIDPAPAENRDQPCTPWSTSIDCAGELEMLFDPWLVGPAPVLERDVIEESQPIQPPVIEPVPEAPGVHASSDSWVVDPGLPEAPFD